jgi:tight adherence protein B
MLILIAVFIFIAVAGTIFAIAALFDQRHAQARMLRERLATVEQAAERAPSHELLLLRDELLSSIPTLHRWLSRSARVSRLQRYIYQADLRVRAGKFLLIALCSGAWFSMIATFVTSSALLAVGLGCAGSAAPVLYVSRRRSRRFQRFESAFPQAIELLSRAVRAGHAFVTALEMVGTELTEPVAGEFRKVFEEQKFGLPIRDALLNLAERMPLVDVKFFVTAVLIQRETGGNLAEILDKLSYVIRERFKIVRQVRVFTAQGRLTMIILMCLPPGLALAMSTVNPEFVSPLWTEHMGHMMVLGALSLQIVGFLLIRRIIRIKV